MRSYLVRIYQRNNLDNPEKKAEVFGVIEGVESGQQTPFTSQDELWNLLTGSFPTAVRGVSRESITIAEE